MDKRNISISKVNGYTLEKVKKAKEYLEEIGSNRRNFDFARLVGMYNEILGTHEAATGCKCQSPKYYNGLQNYYKYGKLTLINNGVATEEDFLEKEVIPEVENAEKRINLGEVSEEEIKKQEIAERMAKARAARKQKKEESND